MIRSRASTHIANIETDSSETCSNGHPSGLAKRIPEFIAWAKQLKDPIPYGSDEHRLEGGYIGGELFAGGCEGIKHSHVG